MPELIAAMTEHGAAVLVAPPGAGKTTVVPPALLDAGLGGGGRIVLLQPRRVAARAAARQMARTRGGRVGDEVGFHVRFERKIGAKTRIEVLTEGLLTRQLQADPLASDLGLVILDEFHERSVHADMALALLAEVRREVRPDLRLLVMTATLDAAPVAAFLGGCPVIESMGRPYPVAVEHAPVPSGARVIDHCASLIGGLLRDEAAESGHVLAFLPGMGEIRRVQERLGGAYGALVLPLHGSLPAQAQDRALAPCKGRKVVLATNVAETSLTIEGVRTVVDSGLARSPRFDAALGLERLETIRIPRASADQRAGRAGRTGFGRCIRLWSQPDDRALAAFEVAEILRTDLCRPLLEIYAWGGRPETFGWFESPSAPQIARAEAVLRAIGALDERGLTPIGRMLARLPVHPRLGRVLIAGHEAGRPIEAAAIAALASERDIFREPPVHAGESDLDLRLQVLEELDDDQDAAAVSRRWGLDRGGIRSVQAARRQLAAAARSALGLAPSPSSSDMAADLRAMLLAGFPDRVGRRRSGAGRRYQMVGGHGAALHPASAVLDAELIVAIGIEAGRRGGTHGDHVIRIAAALQRDELATETRLETRFDVNRLAVEQRVVVHHHGLTIAERQAGKLADEGVVVAVLAEAALADPDRAFALDDDALALLNRLRWLAWVMPELELPELQELGHASADTDAASPTSVFVQSLCSGRRSFAELRKAPIAAAIRKHIGRAGIQALERHAPPTLLLAAGGTGRLSYEPGQPPVLRARIQHLFGTVELPLLGGGRQAVVVHLLAPNDRPAQVTSDLAGFWAGAYLAVRRDLRGRYPKHAWPEKPTAADGRPRRRRR